MEKAYYRVQSEGLFPWDVWSHFRYHTSDGSLLLRGSSQNRDVCVLGNLRGEHRAMFGNSDVGS